MVADNLKIAGLTKFSTCDWPGKITATLFLQGCPWDCFYCHNSALIDPHKPGEISMDEVLEFLSKRHGLLDGVVFSGGEPTMQRELVEAMRAVRAQGFAVGLHSCGAFPTRLAEALPCVDWVGLDIKELQPQYEVVTGRAPSGRHAWDSLDVLLKEVDRRAGSAQPLDYEVRTTVHTAVTSADELGELTTELANHGVTNYAVQEFRPVGVRGSMPVHVPSKGAPQHIGRGGLQRHADMQLDKNAPRPRLDVSQIPRSRFASFTVRASSPLPS